MLVLLAERADTRNYTGERLQKVHLGQHVGERLGLTHTLNLKEVGLA